MARLPFLLLLPLLALGVATAGETRELAAERLHQAVPGLRITIDERLGVARHIASPSAFLTGPGGSGGALPKAVGPDDARPAAVVRRFVDQHAALFGGDGAILDQAELVRDDLTAHSGLRTLAWQQRLDGIPVHRGRLVAHLTAKGELVAIGSGFVPQLPAAAAVLPGRAALVAQPPRDAAAALAAALVALGVDGAGVQVAGAPTGSDLAQLLTAPGALGEVRAHLTWHARAADDLRLAWDLLLTVRGSGIMHSLLVDAQDLSVLFSQRLTSPGLANPARLKRGAGGAGGAGALAAPPVAARATAPVSPGGSADAVSQVSMRVYTGDSPRPLSPGWPDASEPQPAEVARVLVSASAVDVTASSAGWVGPELETRGNNVDAHLDVDANNVPDLPRPLATGSPLAFDFAIDLAQAPSSYRPAAVTNLFYWCNVAHDRLYRLGFTESAGNFQNDNFGHGGAGGDAVQADAQDGSGTDNANFSTPADGIAPRMQMYVFTGPTPDRDSALDASVVLHEYCHGVSNRLVVGGAPAGLDALQSSGMGEGWSDFYALSLLSQPGDDPRGTYTTGSYLTLDYFAGIRRHPYAIEPRAMVDAGSLNPLTFADIAANPEEHDQGEVWCMMLWEARGELVAKHGAAAGNQLMLQLVTDGLKLTPALPSFTDARDAILQADQVLNGSSNHPQLWRAFAKRGLGFGAIAGPSDSTAGVAQSFEHSQMFRVSNVAGLVAMGTPGGPFEPASASFVLGNPTGAPLAWTAARNRDWLTLSASSGSIPAHGSATVTVSLNGQADALTDGTWRDTVSFTDTSHGVTVVRPASLVVGANYRRTSEGFAWTDPAAHANLALGDDTVSAAKTLPFTFTFYGVGTTTVRVGSNGLLGLGAATDLNSQYNDAMPGALTPNAIVAPWWADLDPSAAGSVRYAVTGAASTRRMVASWVDVPHFASAASDGFTFQVVLEEETGDIVMRYLQVRPGLAGIGAGGDATIGVENASGTVAMQHSFLGSAPLANNQALRFHWVGGSPSPANLAPTIAVAAAASPAPVTGTIATVSVTGADDGGESALVYTWSLAGRQDSSVVFNRNGSNAAKSATATFAQAGSYPLRVTVTDRAGASATSTVTVTVAQTLSGLAVTPASGAGMTIGQTRAFAVSGRDQFGAAMAAPAVAWSVTPGGVGTISGAGLFTATGQGGATVTATAGALSGSAAVLVDNSAPTVASAAAASPAPVTGVSAALTVLGADDLGEGALTYAWSTVGTPPAPVNFSASGSHAAKSATATFAKAGSYTLRATISDGSAATVISDVAVTVVQTLSATAVDPASATVLVGGTNQFTASRRDQFGALIAGAPTVTWSVAPAGAGSISSGGLFTAPATAQAVTITASEGPRSGSASVSVVTAPPAGAGAASGGGGGGGGCGLGAGVASLALGLLYLAGIGLGRRRRG